jgi:chemotaxis signal transduction protein/ABC-type nitrate/sulfonate/bicarbonate transport system substrate-binding protein/CheY-like chemotaxis protein
MALDVQMKILLVEDSELTRKMEVKILKKMGFTDIVEADDGDAAVETLKKVEDVGLIISDWNMPNKGGYDLLVRVRGEQQWKHIPFIMATGQAEKKQALKAKEAGVSHFIAKPFSAQELKTVIEETFQAKKDDKNEDIHKGRLPQITGSGKVQFNIAHIQITDHLTLGVLRHLIQTDILVPKHFELRTQCMPSWNPVGRALERGEIDAAFILAPIAMDLFSAGAPIKLVLLAHKNGSICVRNKQGSNGKSLQGFFRGKTFYIPHMLSIHHMLSTMFLRELGLKPGVTGDENVDVFFEVVPPVRMPEFLAQNSGVAAYTVAEPLGTKAIAAGDGELVFLSAELWKHHPCCVVAMRDELIKAHPEAVQELTTMLVRSGQFIARQPAEAAEIGVGFLDPQHTLGLQVPVLKQVLEEPEGIKTDDLFPVVEDLDRIQRYMAERMGVGALIDLEKFVDARFAEAACKETNSVRHPAGFREMSEVVSQIASRQHFEGCATTSNPQGAGRIFPQNTMAEEFGAAEKPEKMAQQSEDSGGGLRARGGKHLIFNLNGQEYGFGIQYVKEIVPIMGIRSIPRSPEYVKGVINLRGKVIPVIDLRLKFGLEALEYNDRTCIVIVEVHESSDMVPVGIVVDAVSEVYNVQGEDIEQAPSLGSDVDAQAILGMAKTDKGVRILLDTQRLMGAAGELAAR